MATVTGRSASVTSISDRTGFFQPVVNLANGAGDEVNGLVDSVAHKLDVPFLGHAITDVTDAVGLGAIGEAGAGGQSNLLTDVVSLPNEVLHGNDPINAVGNIVDDVGDVVGNGHLNNIVEAIHQDGTFPLINASVDGDDQSGGSKHLVDADVGPQQNDGLIANVLAPSDDGSHHAVEANVVQVGSDGPQLVNADLLNSGDHFQFPNLGGQGADGLIGALAGGGGQNGGHAGDASGGASLDLNGLLDIAGVGAVDGQGHGQSEVGVTNLLHDPLHGQHGLGIA